MKAQGVCVVRGGRALLDEISIELEPGTLTAVVGPNGAGKSTLLRSLAGELEPDRGRIEWRGKPIAEWEPRRLAQERAVVAQHVHVAFPWRVLDLVALGRLPHGTGDTEAQRLARAALEEVGMASFAERKTDRLSGGEMQRVHLARALTQLNERSDAVLLLDEPTASLDPIHQHSVLKLARARAQRGWAVLCILHDLALAARYADAVLVLAEGRVVRHGPTREVLEPQLLAEVFQVEAEFLKRDDGDALVVLGPRS